MIRIDLYISQEKETEQESWNQLYFLSESADCLVDLVLVSEEASSFSSLLPFLSNSTKDQTPVPLNLSEPPRAYLPRSKALFMDQ
jgi:hypothetical protein